MTELKGSHTHVQTPYCDEINGMATDTGLGTVTQQDSMWPDPGI